MREEVRRTNSKSRVDNSRKTDQDGDSAVIHFIKPEYLRKSASIRPRQIDRLRSGGRRSNDRISSDPIKNTRDLSPMKHKALIAFAWVTIVSAVATGMIIVLAIRKIGLL